MTLGAVRPLVPLPFLTAAFARFVGHEVHIAFDAPWTGHAALTPYLDAEKVMHTPPKDLRP